MAFIDPQSITIGAVTTPLPRLITGTTVGRFVSADANTDLTIDPRGTAKRRRNVSRLYVKVPVVSATTGLTSIESFMVSVTVDRPLAGVTDQQIIDAYKGQANWLTASTDTNLKKLVAGEN